MGSSKSSRSEKASLEKMEDAEDVRKVTSKIMLLINDSVVEMLDDKGAEVLDDQNDPKTTSEPNQNYEESLDSTPCLTQDSEGRERTNVFYRLQKMLRDTPMLRTHQELLFEMSDAIKDFTANLSNREEMRSTVIQSTQAYSNGIDSYIEGILSGDDKSNLEQHFIGRNELYDSQWFLTRSKRTKYKSSIHYISLNELAQSIHDSPIQQEIIEWMMPGSTLSERIVKKKEFELAGVKVLTEGMKEDIVQIISVLQSIDKSLEGMGTSRSTSDLRNNLRGSSGELYFPNISEENQVNLAEMIKRSDDASIPDLNLLTMNSR